MENRNWLYASLGVLFVFTVLFIFSFTSCALLYKIEPHETIVYDLNVKNDYFEYEIRSYDDHSFIKITKLLNIGDENSLDNIFIPTYIDGLSVEEFGWSGVIEQSNSYINRNRKIYFSKPIVLSSAPTDYLCLIGFPMNLDFFLNRDEVKKYPYYRLLKPNVIYELNYDDLSYGYDYYFDTVIDYIPKDPYRPGYKFTGWYQDKECTTLFDFKNQIIEDIYKESNKDSIYNPTFIYAGWEKVYE